MSGVERAVREAFAAEGLTPSQWSNGPGAVYSVHEHGRHKVLFCVSGSIRFTTPDRSVTLGPGDRLDLPAGTPHSAIVGTAGVTCMEAFRDQ